jgi:hypothetical protein
MDTTKWLKSYVADGILHVSSTRNNACLIHQEDEIAWVEELFELIDRYGCATVALDASGISYLGWIVFDELRHVAACLKQQKGRLVIGGLRLHVLAIFLALAPDLGASNDHAAPAADSVHTALLAA